MTVILQEGVTDDFDITTHIDFWRLMDNFFVYFLQQQRLVGSEVLKTRDMQLSRDLSQKKHQASHRRENSD